MRGWIALGSFVALLLLILAVAGMSRTESRSEAISTAPSPTTTEQRLRAEIRRERVVWARQRAKYLREIRNLRRVTRDVRYPSPAGNRRLAHAYFGDEYGCAAEIIDGETAGTWSETIANYEGSGAYGLGQALPASKMAPYGPDHMTNPLTQLVWFRAYAQSRYGSVCGAAAHWTPSRSW